MNLSLGISAIQVPVRVHKLTLLKYQCSIAKTPCFDLTVRGAVTWESVRLAHKIGAGYTSAWQLRLDLSSRHYASKVVNRLLGSLMVTPHCQETISKRPNGQAECTQISTVGHVGDSTSLRQIFANDSTRFRHKAAFRYSRDM